MSDKKKPANGKKPAGKHTTKRVNVGVPDDWHAVMRQLAAKKKQPVLWVLIELVTTEAAKYDLACPPPPWDEPGA